MATLQKAPENRITYSALRQIKRPSDRQRLLKDVPANQLIDLLITALGDVDELECAIPSQHK